MLPRAERQRSTALRSNCRVNPEICLSETQKLSEYRAALADFVSGFPAMLSLLLMPPGSDV
jgi:hypothetical protein